MTETLTLITERVDDIPLLLAQMQKLEMAQNIDKHLSVHGNRKGLSYGALACIWLTHIISQADHRMNQVRQWAAQRTNTLQSLMPMLGTQSPTWGETDFTDDRLADLLKELSDDSKWELLEADLNAKSIAVYDLPTEVVRLDATTVSLDTDPEGLFALGHSKDHRPDVAQVKIMMATLDPLSMPLLTHIVAGNSADDPLYLPAVEQIRKSVGKRGLLYVGDCKMAAKATRAGIASGADWYLCPLAQTQMPPEQLAQHLRPVLTGQQSLTSIERIDKNGQLEVLGEGYEWTESQQLGDFCWQERRLLVRSHAFAKAAERGLQTRLASAQSKISQLSERGKGKRCPKDGLAAQEAVDAIVSHYKLDGLLDVTINEKIHKNNIRGYGGNPDRIESNIEVEIIFHLNSSVLKSHIASLGWRVYVTNTSSDRLSFNRCILLYREEYRVEQSFGRLKGHPLSISPLYVSREDHAKGMIRLLALGLRLLGLLEFAVRRRLSELLDPVTGAPEPLFGLYAGNPKRSTLQPTAESLLKAFKEISLTLVNHSGQILRHVTALNLVQERILKLLDYLPEVYIRLLEQSVLPPQKMSEP
jgi:transposase